MKYALLMTSAVSALIAGSTCASAQSATTYSASNQWGTTSSGAAVTGALESSQAHSLNGAIASQVNGTKQGVLVSNGSLGGGSLTISSVGSQTIVSSSVVATNSTVTSPINATQTSSNSGAVTNQGTINVK